MVTGRVTEPRLVPRKTSMPLYSTPGLGDIDQIDLSTRTSRAISLFILIYIYDITLI